MRVSVRAAVLVDPVPAAPVSCHVVLSTSALFFIHWFGELILPDHHALLCIPHPSIMGGSLGNEGRILILLGIDIVFFFVELISGKHGAR